jgi:5-methylcytosine-specific restriction endonuclease McrA
MERLKKPAPRHRKAKRPIRRKAKRKAKLHDADRLFSQYIRTRDGWQCQVCGEPFNIQCGHLISRRYRAVRFSPINAVAICARHHVFYTHRPIEWEAWVEERFPGRLSVLKAQALAAHEHPDYDAVCESLRAAIGVRG